MSLEKLNKLSEITSKLDRMLELAEEHTRKLEGLTESVNRAWRQQSSLTSSMAMLGSIINNTPGRYIPMATCQAPCGGFASKKTRTVSFPFI